MLISNVHKSIIVMNSLDTRFSRNVFEAVQKTCSTCFTAVAGSCFEPHYESEAKSKGFHMKTNFHIIKSPIKLILG